MQITYRLNYSIHVAYPKPQSKRYCSQYIIPIVVLNQVKTINCVIVDCSQPRTDAQAQEGAAQSSCAPQKEVPKGIDQVQKHCKCFPIV